MIQEVLLKYYELDTLGMVVLWEYWSKDLISKGMQGCMNRLTFQ